MMLDWAWEPERQRWEVRRELPGVLQRLVVQGDATDQVMEDIRNVPGIYAWMVLEQDEDGSWWESAHGFRKTPRAGMVAAEREAELGMWYMEAAVV